MVVYNMGRAEKGNGVGSVAGYWIYKISAYMDSVVEMTNIFNECDIDYFLMAFGTCVTSLSGALDLVTNFMFRLFSETEV